MSFQVILWSMSSIIMAFKIIRFYHYSCLFVQIKQSASPSNSTEKYSKAYFSSKNRICSPTFLFLLDLVILQCIVNDKKTALFLKTLPNCRTVRSTYKTCCVYLPNSFRLWKLQYKKIIFYGPHL